MSRLFSPAMHQAQLETAWPEWEFRFDAESGAFVATLRAEGDTVLIAGHLGALEGLLLEWDRQQVRP